MNNHKHAFSYEQRAIRASTIWAVWAAVLFGLVAPAAKWLLSRVHPLTLAGLFYLGSGVGLFLLNLASGRIGLTRPKAGRILPRSEAPLLREDLPWLAGAILSGGVAAPVLMMFGLSMTSGSAGSLLLNLEGILTALLASLFFREAVSGRIWAATVLMTCGGILLSWVPGTTLVASSGPLMVAGACALWGLDNNLTCRFSGKDPLVIAMVKGLVAGGVNIVLARTSGASCPPATTLLAAMTIGSLSYGASLVLFIHAMRGLGATRTCALFGLAPFIGAGASVLFLGDPVTPALVASALLMGAGAWLVLREGHEHEHSHDEMRHDHRHVHDQHHCHLHPAASVEEPHSHPHLHSPLDHSHRHSPDLHHRHTHL